jgi:hypothetical protein
MTHPLASTMAAALLASAGLCASALAQDKAAPPTKAEKTQVTPGKNDLKQSPATLEKMDDNAQRIHDRDRAAAPRGSASNVQTTATATSSTRAAADGVRDWAAIDKNKDNLISPEEMEAHLAEGRPAAQPAPAKQ